MLRAGLLEYAYLLQSAIWNLSLQSWLSHNLTAVVLFGVLILILLVLVFRS